MKLFFIFFYFQDCFLTGCGVQLRAESGGGCLRCMADGRIDAKGSLGNDYTSML